MTGRWFSSGTLVSSINKTDRHETTEILLKVALNTIALTPSILSILNYTDKCQYHNVQLIFTSDTFSLDESNLFLSQVISEVPTKKITYI